MSNYCVAVVGVGAVGEEILRVLAERRFPAKSIRVLARTPRTITVDATDYKVEATTPESFDGVDIALFCGTEGVKGAAVTFGPDAVKRGAVVIDNGADFRMDAGVPLCVPEVNGDALRGHKGIIANPNCSTAQLVMALKPIHDFARVRRVIVSTYQAVSGAGSSAIEELQSQHIALAEGRAISHPGPNFPYQIAGNVIPHIGGFDDAGYTSEEMKLVHETRKILGDDSIAVTPVVTARVPVVTGHSEAVLVETERPITPAEARKLWHEFDGVAVMDDLGEKLYPTPLMGLGRDTTLIGRIRQDLDNPRGLAFWVVADNLRKGAATNAVQIAETLVAKGWLKN